MRRTKKEAKATMAVMELCRKIFTLFELLDINGQTGLQKCALRICLFMMEETDQGREIDKNAVKELIRNDFVEDQKGRDK